ncbi:carbohydrate ABC transporter permease [Brachybacterium sp. YJGR34]|uniref:carbohydrate ABC transporter permease n=1 Tax=Brachybacterium sp. YJGR34 TaxID=2059911 RepID=UPI0018E637E8|nr:sugar ABC transporter permease [Brachybacterium sp. YJGR34]
MSTATRNPEAAWRRRDRLWGMAFVAPQALGMAVFTLLPFAVAFYLAFTEWNGFGTPQWVGLANFADQIGDPLLRRSILNTLVLALVTVPIGLGLSMVLATMLNSIRRRGLYLLLLFAPVVTSQVAIALIWQQMLRPDGAFSSLIARVLGVVPPDWLANPYTALAAVCLVTIWASVGLNTVIFMAGLQNISPSVLEAAQIDGAGVLTRFLRIVLPMVSPVIFYQSVVAFISSLQTFDLVFVLVKDAGPDNGTRTIVYHIYDEGFQKSDFGVSSAASIILLALTLLITAIQFGAQKRFVHYEE